MSLATTEILVFAHVYKADCAFLARMCSTTQNSHTGTIQKLHFTSIRPMVVDEDTMQPIKDSTPSLTLLGCYLYDFGSLLLQFHNAIISVSDADDATRYAMILKYDGELRAISVEKVPKALSPRTPLNPTWPKWTKWARELLQYMIS
jgi:hypothetical protein